MHHGRRKSGHGVSNTSMTDVRRAVTATDPSRFKRPTTLSRRTTPNSSAQKLGRSPREREREWQDSYDERESFPQFCMACEKQFLPHDDKFLYCSEACRLYDQDAYAQDDAYKRGMSSGYGSHHAMYSMDYSEPRDIIPRASPSRPSSTNFSPPTSPGTMSSHYQQHYSSAISALRSLNVHPPSPPSPDDSHPSLWPFSKTAATSPSTSYKRSGSGFFSSTYDTGYGTAGHGYNYSTSGMDRPLPTRRPTGYSRPKSIELVTPMVGR